MARSLQLTTLALRTVVCVLVFVALSLLTVYLLFAFMAATTCPTYEVLHYYGKQLLY
jgi:hypothetical protein